MKQKVLSALLLLGMMFFTKHTLATPSIVVEESENGYVMYLEIGDVSNFQSIYIEGGFSINGKADAYTWLFEGNQLSSLGNNLTALQELNHTFDYGHYVIKVVDKDGYILEYPMVKVQMSDL